MALSQDEIHKSAIEQLEAILQVIKGGERQVTNISTGFYKNQVTDLAIRIEYVDEDEEGSK